MMKFKTKEELIGNREMYRTPINEAFKSFAERVEFYKKYKHAPEYFTGFNPENKWWKQNKNEYKKLNNTMTPSSEYYKEHYALQNLIKDFNNWLFDHCFKDVIKNVR